MLLDIREGALEAPQVLDMIEKIRLEVEAAIPTCSLPQIADLAPLQDWYISLRYSWLTQAHQNRQTIPKAAVPTEMTAESEALYKMGTNLLQKHKVNGVLMCLMISGSDLHNTRVDSCEKDYIGIFTNFEPKMPLLPQAPISIDKQGVNISPQRKLLFVRGLLLIELSHALRLLLKGDHRVFELFGWSCIPSFSTVYCSPRWELLRASMMANPISILSKALLQHNIEDIRNQVNGHQKLAKKNKKLYHMMRLIFHSRSILQSKFPELRASDGEDRDLLMGIKTGSFHKAEDLGKVALRELMEQLEKSELPDNVDIKQLEKLFFELLLDHVTEDPEDKFR